jgi:Fe2+-dicitrate sensor, membrane component
MKEINIRDVKISDDEAKVINLMEYVEGGNDRLEVDHIAPEVVDDCAVLAEFAITESEGDDLLKINTRKDLKSLYDRSVVAQTAMSGTDLSKPVSSGHRRLYRYLRRSAAASVIIAAFVAMGVAIFGKNDNVLVFEANNQVDSVVVQSVVVDGVNFCKLVVPRGKTYSVVLSDSSEVMINADSEFYYPDKFVGSKRVVSLAGEAYFKVKKDDNGRPFIVKTKNVEVNVLGTEFNVKGYPIESTSVTLINGSVEVSDTLMQNSAAMQPSECVDISPVGEMSVKSVDVGVYSNGMDGMFYFDDASLYEISQTIGRWYNIDIEFCSKGVGDIRMHFVADKFKPVDHLVTLLNNTNSIRAEVIDGKLVVDKI